MRRVPDVIDVMHTRRDGPGGATESLVPWVCVARIVAAGTMLAVPGPVARGTGLGPWPPGPGLVRVLGARELILGVGTLRAWSRGRHVATWVGAQSLADTVDTALFLLAVRSGRLPAGRGLAQAAFACSGAVVEAVTWHRSRRGTRP